MPSRIRQRSFPGGSCPAAARRAARSAKRSGAGAGCARLPWIAALAGALLLAAGPAAAEWVPLLPKEVFEPRFPMTLLFGYPHRIEAVKRSAPVWGMEEEATSGAEAPATAPGAKGEAVEGGP